MNKVDFLAILRKQMELVISPVEGHFENKWFE